MKASESLPNYESKSRETTNFIIKSIKTVCKDNPSRLAGSEGEQKAQQYVADTMAPFADSVETQEFTAKVSDSRKVRKNGIVLLVSIILAAICSVIIFLFPFELSRLIMLIPFIALAFAPVTAKKASSKNVIVCKKPSGELKRRVVFAGNINSPVERHLLRIGSVTLEKIAIYSFIVGILVCDLYDGLYVLILSGKIHPLVTLFQLIFIPAAILMMIYFKSGQIVQGANGNLTGVFDSMAVIQYLSYNNLSLENTEVVAVSCGAGHIGAKEYLKEYSKKYTDVPTAFISVDCLQNTECFGISGEAASLIREAAQNAGVKVDENKDSVGSSLIRSAKGMPVNAARISALDEENHVFAAREDVPTALSPMAIEAGLKLSLEAAYLFDEKGI
jgi:hypothetical protein